jgi:hypothetical protein
MHVPVRVYEKYCVRKFLCILADKFLHVGTISMISTRELLPWKDTASYGIWIPGLSLCEAFVGVICIARMVIPLYMVGRLLSKPCILYVILAKLRFAHWSTGVIDLLGVDSTLKRPLKAPKKLLRALILEI